MIQPIFILSLPRSGSTLLQRILLSTDKCATLGEPSLLLRFLGSNQAVPRYAIYRESNIESSMHDMRAKKPEFDTVYRDGVQKLMLDLYESLADGKPYFIDKTPRYTLICEEILKTFPTAKFIILWRHPLAIAASVSSTFYKNRWRLGDFITDLTIGIERLHDFEEKYTTQVCSVRYEDLVSDSSETLRQIGDYLGWAQLPQAADTVLPKSVGGTLGDPSGVNKYAKLSNQSRDAWIEQYNNWYRARWAQKYFAHERAEWLKQRGYTLPDAIQTTGMTTGIFSGLSEMIFAMKKRKSHQRRIQRVFEKHPIYDYKYKPAQKGEDSHT